MDWDAIKVWVLRSGGGTNLYAAIWALLGSRLAATSKDLGPLLSRFYFSGGALSKMAMVGALGLESNLSNARGAYLVLGTPFSFTSSF